MVGDVRLAATWTPNPEHPATWIGFFWALLGVAGCLIAITGATVTVALWRVSGRKKWGNYILGPVILMIGLAIAALGFWSR
jgi:hypothetical protein